MDQNHMNHSTEAAVTEEPSDSRVDSGSSAPLLLNERAAVKETKVSEPGALKTELRTETKRQCV